MDKVKISKELASDIATFRRDGYTNKMIIEMTSGNANGFIVENIKKLANADYEYFLKVLVIGYEVEETPEDKVKKLYKLNKDACIEAKDSDTFNYFSDKCNMIETVLGLLNIKIVGVNHE